jgi:hypothetical protein
VEKLNIDATNENAATALNPYLDAEQQQKPCRSSGQPDQSRLQEQPGKTNNGS